MLESAGSDLAHVVQTRNYIRDSANTPLYNKLYAEYFTAPLPARTTITGCLQAILHYEVDCMAVPKVG